MLILANTFRLNATLINQGANNANITSHFDANFNSGANFSYLIRADFSTITITLDGDGAGTYAYNQWPSGLKILTAQMNWNQAASNFFGGSDDFVNANANAAIQFDSTYTVFGTVIAGMDVVDAISKVAVGPNGSGENSKPLTDVVLLRAEILP